MSIAASAPGHRVPILFTQGFRPFFLAAGVWSAVALAAWIGVLTIGFELPSRFDALTWHIHEMFFGFVMAAIAGFLLTAVPNWTKRLPVGGWPLIGLVGLWLLGRIACMFSALVPSDFAITADLAFPVVLVAVVAREIIAGKNWRNLPMTAPIAVLGIGNLFMHLESTGSAVSAGLGWRIVMAGIVALISVVGGRIIPSFTRNWLMKRRAKQLPATHGWIDRGALGFLHAGLLAWAILPEFEPIGWVLLAAGGLNCWRLFRWRGLGTVGEPLVAVLHLGYAWLAIGTALLGAASLGTGVPQSAAIHALTAGAIGTMTLAVMTRATLGHTGQALSANRGTIAIYILVTAAALVRVIAAFESESARALFIAAAVLWIAAFSLFVFYYGPMLIFPKRPDRK